MWLPLDVYEKEHDLACSVLSEHLSKGTLSLFLGAGSSNGMGLPKWWELVKNCREKIGLGTAEINENTSNDILRISADEFRIKCLNDKMYKEVLRDCLYQKAKEDSELLNQKLLAVLGSMIMKSKRGSIQEVMTLNFDDVLERYLKLHGFIAKTIIELPCLIPFADAIIYHPHGFLPSSGEISEASEKIIFGQYSYDQRFAEHGAWWEMALRLLVSKVNIFIGLSIEDPILRSLIVSSQNILENAKIKRPTGFWLLGPKDKLESENMLMMRNIAPIRLPTYEGYPNYLLKICQESARKMDL